MCIEFLLRSDGRCQTERESVPDVSNEPNPFYVALGPPFILSRGHPQVATQTRRVKMEKDAVGAATATVDTVHPT